MPILRLRDDLGRDVIIARPPERVVSLVPSDTYSLFALGCGARVVGRTRYCELPPEAAAIPAVGGTKDVDVDAVLALSPDLVIANQEENTRPALTSITLRTKRQVEGDASFVPPCCTLYCRATSPRSLDVTESRQMRSPQSLELR